MEDTASFRLIGMFSFQTAGSGRIRRKRSEITGPTPWITTRTRVLLQDSDMKAARKSSCESPVEGEHMTAKQMETDRWNPTTSMIAMMDVMRIHLMTLKILRYRIKTETLTKQSAWGASISTRRASLLVSRKIRDHRRLTYYKLRLGEATKKDIPSMPAENTARQTYWNLAMRCDKLTVRLNSWRTSYSHRNEAKAKHLRVISECCDHRWCWSTYQSRDEDNYIKY